MGRAGLCTIAFKTKPIDEVLQIAADTGASAVEIWAQPPHLDYPLDFDGLEATRKKADKLGLQIVALGSYFQPGKEVSFNGIRVDETNQIEAGKALGAGLIRIWPGNMSHEETSVEQRNAIYDIIRRFADAAASNGLRVALERHIGSLTHGWTAPAHVLKELAHANVGLNYQIPYPVPVDEYASRSVDDYTTLMPLSTHAHIQNYFETPEGKLVRTLLDRGVIDYGKLGAVASECGYDGCFMIEFPAEIRGGLSAVESIAADVAYLDSL